jgi:hypothetical protein
MFSKSVVVSAKPESNKLNSRRGPQSWSVANDLARSSEHGRRLSTVSPFTGEWRPAKPTPVGRSLGAGSATILNFESARNGGSGTQVREALSNETQGSLSLIDFVAAAYALLATALYPAMTWLLLS